MEEDDLMPHGRHLLCLYIHGIFPFLYRKHTPLIICKVSVLCAGDGYQLILRPGRSIPYGPGVLLRQGCVLREILLHLNCDFFNGSVIFMAVLIYLMDGGAGYDIMELVGQDQLPALCEAFLFCFFQASCHEALHNGHPLSPAVQKLHFPVHAFVVALAGVSSPVVFQIQFPVPGIYILVCVLYCLLQFSEILPCCGCFHMRQSRNPVQSPSLFQHVTVHTPAAVSESISDEQVFVHLLLTVGIPHAFYSLWHKLAVVGVEPGARFIPGFRCGDEMGQHFAAVNALPFEGVVRHTVKLVPAYLCGHEHINAGFFQDLGKCPGVAEHIRQPKVFHIFSELILDEFAPD